MNPFEIRLELLKLAQQIETERVMTERIRLENDWQVASDKLRNAPIDEFPAFPNMPSVSAEAIIKTAEALNAFVSTTPNVK